MAGGQNRLKIETVKATRKQRPLVATNQLTGEIIHVSAVSKVTNYFVGLSSTRVYRILVTESQPDLIWGVWKFELYENWEGK